MFSQVLASVLIASSLQTSEQVKPSIHTLSPESPKAIRKKGTAVVDYYAMWCAPCRRMLPIYTSVATEMASRKITFYKCEAKESVWKELNIKSIPCIILYKDGKEIKRTGSLSRQALIQWIKEG